MKGVDCTFGDLNVRLLVLNDLRLVADQGKTKLEEQGKPKLKAQLAMQPLRDFSHPTDTSISLHYNPKLHLSSVKDVQELLASNTTWDALLDRCTLLCSALLLNKLLSAEGLCVRVKTEEDGLVSEGVLLLGEGSYNVSSKTP